jgi:spermidine/putrescine transport system permease protein
VSAVLREPAAPGRLGRWALTLAAWLIYAFLYLPLVVVVLYSFNGDTINSWPIHHWSLAAYSTLGGDSDLTQSIRNSVYVSCIAVSIAVVLGTAAALGFHQLRIPG